MMRSGESLGFAALLVWLVFCLIGGVASAWLVRRLWRRRAELPIAARVLAPLVAVSAAFGAVGMLLGIVRAIGAARGESVDPSQRARMLAEGIAEAMNCTALGVVVWVPSVVVALMLTRPRQAPPRKA